MTKLFYRVGVPAEGSLFEEYKEKYYGFVIRANIVKLYETWTTAFIRNLSKPYFIDPITYLFSLNLENICKEGSIKKSFSKLIEMYGTEFESIIIGSDREVLPSDFKQGEAWNETLIHNFVSNVLKFQTDFKKLELQKTLTEIYEIMGIQESNTKPELEFLISPYFYFEALNDPWYDINLKLASVALEYKKKNSLYPVLCISKNLLLDIDGLNKVILDYNKFEGLILWISEFNELSEDTSYLEALANFLKLVSDSNIKLIMLYGGFFSLLLSLKYNFGYVRNIGYGEQRPVEITSAGGSPPQRNFYLPRTNLKISEAKVRTLFSLHPDLKCQCEFCETLPQDDIDIFFNRFEINDFKKHFMNVHFLEKEMSFDELVNYLQDNLNKCIEYKLEDLGIKYSHLERWISVIEKIQ